MWRVYSLSVFYEDFQTNSLEESLYEKCIATMYNVYYVTIFIFDIPLKWGGGAKLKFCPIFHPLLMRFFVSCNLDGSLLFLL